MSDPAVNPGPDGRHPDGRFAPGNRIARGNPIHRRMAHLRSALLDAATAEDVRAVAAKLAELARQGDVAAAKVWLEHTVGKPPAALELTGPDGTALGLSFGELAVELVAVLGDFPEARSLVAARLRALARGLPRPDDGGDQG